MIKRLSKIKIQDNFKKPNELKMIQKWIYYALYRKFEQPIVIDKEGYLIDGYTTYLIAKKLSKKFIRVKRVSL